MSSLHISQGSFRLSDTRTLELERLDIQSGDSWAFVGANGSGKSALARALAGELTLLKGERHSDFRHVVRLSFEQLQKLVSDEWQRNNTDSAQRGRRRHRPHHGRNHSGRAQRFRSLHAVGRAVWHHAPAYAPFQISLPVRPAKPCCAVP